MNHDSAFGFEEKLKDSALLIERYLKSFMLDFESSKSALKLLAASISYSTLSGGKRFRPVLSLWTAEALGIRKERLIPYGVAVELIHTYSLIHDDLPCMDNDDERRGKPTNHKVFGETVALLAGDCLQPEAFGLIARSYSETPALALRAIMELSRASGIKGMVGGQAIDLKSQVEGISLEDLELMHKMKTGALIRASVIGAAHLCEARPEQTADLIEYSETLGLAFQVADDLLDHNPTDSEKGSYTELVGFKETKVLLQELTEKGLKALVKWNDKAEPLRELLRYNLNRKN